MYKIHGTSAIYRCEDGAFIPLDERNGDYRAYLVWLKTPGNTPMSADMDLDKAIAVYKASIVKQIQARSMYYQ